MHETSLCDAANPSPVVVLSLPLRTYSLGHECELYQRRNPLLLLSHAQFNELPYDHQIFALKQAVLICVDSWSARRQLEQPSFLYWRNHWHNFKIWNWTRRLDPSEFPVALAEFRNYLDEAHELPPTPKDDIDKALNGRSEPGRAFGAPLLLNLYGFLDSRIPTHSNTPLLHPIWDAAYRFTCWRYFAFHESQGAYKIENLAEWTLRDKNARMEREILADQAKREAASSMPSTPSTSSGLATPPPNLDTEVPHGI